VPLEQGWLGTPPFRIWSFLSKPPGLRRCWNCLWSGRVGPRGLVALNLCRNAISAEGCAALATALAGLTSPTRLNSESKKLGDEGAEALGEALSTLRALRAFDLSHNGLGPRGGAAVASVMSSLGSIHLLGLGQNSLGLPRSMACGAWLLSAPAQ
jgi:hypothetical protein